MNGTFMQNYSPSDSEFNPNENLKNTKNPEITILIFPAELLVHIFQFLSAIDLARISLVCTAFKNAAENNILWKSLTKKYLSTAILETNTHYYSYIKENYPRVIELQKSLSEFSSKLLEQKKVDNENKETILFKKPMVLTQKVKNELVLTLIKALTALIRNDLDIALINNFGDIIKVFCANPPAYDLWRDGTGIDYSDTYFKYHAQHLNDEKFLVQMLITIIINSDSIRCLASLSQKVFHDRIPNFIIEAIGDDSAQCLQLLIDKMDRTEVSKKISELVKIETYKKLIKRKANTLPVLLRVLTVQNVFELTKNLIRSKDMTQVSYQYFFQFLPKEIDYSGLLDTFIEELTATKEQTRKEALLNSIEALLKEVQNKAAANTLQNKCYLHQAANNNADLFKIFLKSGLFEINQQDEEGKTALHITVKNNNIETTKLLIIAGADPNIADKQSCIPLHYVTQTQWQPKAFTINHEKFTSSSDSYESLEYNQIPIIRILLQTPSIDVNKENSSGHNALYLAAFNYNLPAVNLILEYQSDDNEVMKVFSAISKLEPPKQTVELLAYINIKNALQNYLTNKKVYLLESQVTELQTENKTIKEENSNLIGENEFLKKEFGNILLRLEKLEKQTLKTENEHDKINPTTNNARMFGRF